MTPEDLARIEAEYERVHAATKSVLLSDNPADPDQHQTDLNTVMGGLDATITHFDGLVKHYQHLRDSTKDKKRDLERDFDASKRAYWRLRDEKKRSGISPNQQ